VDVQTLMANINAWAGAVVAAGYQAGLYVGADSLMTSQELYQLHVTAYWKSQSRIVDRYGNLAEPSCGWCLLQTYPSISLASINVDVDIMQQDYQSRLPSWVTRTTGAPNG
jgi:hypothetical protein